jgi:hypothetical protein
MSEGTVACPHRDGTRGEWGYNSIEASGELYVLANFLRGKNPGTRWNMWLCGPYSGFGRFGEEGSLLPVPGFKPASSSP